MAFTHSKKNIIASQLLEIIVHIFYKIFSFFNLRNQLNDKIDKILIIEPFQMGDVISLSVMFEPLKKKFPETSIIVLTKNNNERFLNLDKRISVITSEFPWSDYNKTWAVKRYIKLFTDIMNFRKLKINIGMDPRGDIRSQIVLLMIGCKERIGYTNYANSNLDIKGLLLTKKAITPSSVHRYDWNLNLLKYMGINETLSIKFPSIKINTKVEINKSKKGFFVLIHPGGGWYYKRWPLNNWIKLIETLSQNDQVEIMVTGGENEKEILTNINHSIFNREVEFKVTNFNELIEYIQLSDLNICLDSGPMNLAVCLDKPVIALFGPGDSDSWKPYSAKSYFIHKKENFPCNPCFQKFCYYPNKNCMAEISVDEVLGMVRKYIV